MPDITMCHGNDCPLKTKCYRYTAYADPYGQSIFTEIHYNDGKCKHFWDNKGKRNRPDGEPMFNVHDEDGKL
jgi:hypothetical protein